MHRWPRVETRSGCAPFGAMNALAQTTTDYRRWYASFCSAAMTRTICSCPFDTTGYGNYANYPRAVALGGAAAASDADAELRAESELAGDPALYNSGKAALPTNVGTLMQPTTQAQFLADQGASRRTCSLIPISNWNGRTRP